MIAVLIIGDGRDEIHERAVASLEECVVFGADIRKVVVDDRDHSLGFGGAIRSAWAQVVEHDALFDYVFHFEADFVFNAEVRIDPMIRVLKRRPYLAQLSLKRQPWNEREIAAGGIVEADPDDFRQVTDAGDIWTEQRKYWTTNPSVYSASWCHSDWPTGADSEGRWSHRLMEDPNLKFGIWGAKFDPPVVEHIGVDRVGVGY